MMKKYLLINSLFILAMVLIQTSCTSNEIALSDPLDGTSWNLFAYRKSRPIPGTKITAEFENGQVHGSAGCNTFSGEYTISGGMINFENVASTLMACLDPEGIMEQEQLIMEFIWDAQNFRLSADQLMIYRSDGEALTFLPMDM